MINVEYKVITTAFQAKQYLSQLPLDKPIALDFETAVKYTPQQIDLWKNQIENGNLTKLEKVALENKINATALGHPSHVRFTHCSLAISNNLAIVFIMDNTAITNYILNFLITTNIQQIWHNASYDFKILNYYTNKFPKFYEDTALLAKCLTNHVETHKAGVKLKELAGHMYGAWGISSDNFDVSHMYELTVLKYAATDACATYWLWQYMQEECDVLDKEILDEFNTTNTS